MPAMADLDIDIGNVDIDQMRRFVFDKQHKRGTVSC